ncbi:HEAT repeat domain-containing protein [Myxococcus sp. MxC21-1]|nr:HEAT repeat domain-containing protein [Myxococcus sp. MxC21-1]WNZ62417.1 HEAT repeat domain-containing protein [Myxococcus sp. MxC21-1]
MLDDENADVRAAALDAVVALDADAPLASAEAALRSGHEDVRVRGLDRLVKLGAAAPGAEALLGDALEDESSKVRGEAFRTLWAWNEKAPEKALDRALAGRFPDLRHRAVEVLAQRAAEGWALERLKKAVEDRDTSVATAAYDAWVKHVGKEHAEAHRRRSPPRTRRCGSTPRRAPSTPPSSPCARRCSSASRTRKSPSPWPRWRPWTSWCPTRTGPCWPGSPRRRCRCACARWSCWLRVAPKTSSSRCARSSPTRTWSGSTLQPSWCRCASAPRGPWRHWARGAC